MAQTKTDRIFEALQNRILAGELPQGTRLDSLRQACRHYGVSKNIVVTVYDRLVARGLITARQGAGFFVAHRPSMAVEPENLQEAIDTVSLLRAQLDRPHTVLAGDGRPPENWLLNAVAALTVSAGEGGYGTPHGLLALREYIAAAQLAQGIEVAPSQIVTTFGANHALDLVIRRFVRAGDPVLVDDPGYYPLFAKLRLAGAKVIGVPRRPSGPDPDLLGSLANEYGARLFFTQSLGQNPTGCSITLPIAHAILQVAERQEMLVVDDDPFLDLPGIEGTRLAHLDLFDRVIQVGSYSKTLSPSLRSGYIIASPGIASNLAELKMILTVSSSSYTERIIANLIRSRRYEKIKFTMARRLSEARAEGMRRLSSLGLSLFAEPHGGLYGWLKLPDGLDDLEMAREASAHGIFLAPGSLFQAGWQAHPPGMRINWSRVNDSRFYSFLRRIL